MSAEVQVFESDAVISLPRDLAVTRNRINMFNPVTDSGPRLPDQLTVSSPNMSIEGEIPPISERYQRLATNDAVQGIPGVRILYFLPGQHPHRNRHRG